MCEHVPGDPQVQMMVDVLTIEERSQEWLCHKDKRAAQSRPYILKNANRSVRRGGGCRRGGGVCWFRRGLLGCWWLGGRSGRSGGGGTSVVGWIRGVG